MATLTQIVVNGVTYDIQDIFSGFVTASVNNLVNYYLKSDTYTKTEVNNLIAAIRQFHYEVYASTSAVTNPASNVLYLIGPTGSGTDKYDEYVYDPTKPFAERWIKIGDTSVDLSGYVTTTALNTALAAYTTTANLTTMLAAKQDTISDLSTIRSGAAAGATAYQKPGTGIPKTDLASAVQTSLGKADTALQSDFPAVKYTSQSLTSAQKAQARQNIEALTYDPVGGITPPVNPNEYATAAELSQLSQEIYGKSLTLVESVPNKYLDSTGAEVTLYNYTILRYEIGGIVDSINVKFTAGSVAYTHFYDSGGTIISSIAGSGAIDTTFAVPAGAKTVAFSFSIAYAYDISITDPAEGIMPKVEELDPVETTPTPGGTSWRLLQQDGAIVAANSGAWYVSDPVRIFKGQTLEITVDNDPVSPYVTVQLKYEDGTIVNYINEVDIYSGVKKTIQISKNGYARVGYQGNNGLGFTAKVIDSVRNIAVNSREATIQSIDRNVRFVGMSIWYLDGQTLPAGFMGGVFAEGYQTNLRRAFKFRSDSGTTYCYDGGSLGAKNSTDAYSIMYQSSGWTSLSDAIWTLDTITNDFKRDIPIGSVTDYENATGILTYYGALRAFRDKVASLSGSSAIVICSNALHRNNNGYTSTSQNANGDTLADFERALMTVAAKNGWYFVDQFRLSAIQDNSIDITTIDGLHLNNFGYTLAVKPWIEQFKIIGGY